MGYFSKIADRSFVTSPAGERLFVYNGPWSRPYVVPDQATETRLRKKVQLMWKVTLLLIVSVPFALLVYVLAIVILANFSPHTPKSHPPQYEDVPRLGNPSQQTTIYNDRSQSFDIPQRASEQESRPDVLIVLLLAAALGGIAQLGQRLLFRNELKQMRQLPTRIPIKDFYRPYAQSNSYPLLFFALLMFGSMAILETFSWTRRLWVEGVTLETFIYPILLACLWMIVLGIGFQIFLKISSKQRSPQPPAPI